MNKWELGSLIYLTLLGIVLFLGIYASRGYLLLILFVAWPVSLFFLSVGLLSLAVLIFSTFHRFPRLTSLVFMVGFIGATATFYLANMPEPLEPPSAIDIEKAKAVAQRAARIVAYADWLVLHCEPSFVVNPSVSTGWTMYAEAEAGFDQDFFDNELAIQKALVGERDASFEGCKSAAEVLPTGTVSER